MDIIELREKLMKGMEKGNSGHKLFGELHDEKVREGILGNPALKEYLEELRQVAQECQNTAIKALPWHLFKGFDTTGNRTEYEKEYFEHRKILMTFGLMAWLYREPEDIAALEDIIWTVCEEYTWCLPAHLNRRSLEPSAEDVYEAGRFLHTGFDPETNIDLFAAETAAALAEIIYMLEECLAPMVVQRARKEVFRRVLNSYLRYPGIYSWEMMKNNWAAVCAGSIGIAGIYLLEDVSVLAQLHNRLSPSLDHFLESFEADGTCLEGLSYWTYGISFYVAYGDLLKRRTAGQIDLLMDERFEKIAAFQHKCYFPGGWTVSFSDANARDCYRSGLTDYLRSRFPSVQIPADADKAGYSFDGCFRWCPGLRDLLWTEKEPNHDTAVRGMEEPAEDHSDVICEVLPEAQWMLCKQYGGRRLGLAVKGGHNDEPHNHNDIGSFVFYKEGECLLCDLGSGEYTRDYFGEKRYSVFCTGSFGHSVPIINGKGQEPGREPGARDAAFPEKGRMVMDIAPAYNDRNLVGLLRDMTYREEEIVLRDTFRMSRIPDEVNHITERVVTLHEPRLERGFVLIKGERTECRIEYDDRILKPRIRQHEHTDHAGISRTVYSVDFEAEMAEEEMTLELRMR